MTIGCNIWMICLKLNWFFTVYVVLQFSQFVWPLSYSVWDVFNNFLLIEATDRSKINSDQKRFFIALSLYPLSFFANTPFKGTVVNQALSCLKVTWNYAYNLFLKTYYLFTKSNFDNKFIFLLKNRFSMPHIVMINNSL